MTRRVLPYGDAGLLLECGDRAETAGVLRTLQRLALPEVTELVPGATTVFLRLDRPLSSQRRRALLDLAPDERTAENPDQVEIAVRYDGEDLTEVADRLGLTVEQVIAAHTDQRWTVGFCGFAPGFGYLYGEDQRLRVPRRDRPRTSVPAGAVGLADVWSGIYPRRGPGGWQLIGTTDRRLWDLTLDPPALLRPGTTVRFVRES